MKQNYKPYTYLIGWTKLDRWYYGVQIRETGLVANPSNLWKTYFTSSKTVHKFRELFGEPDVIQVRKVFTNRNDAFNWEQRVIYRVLSRTPIKWLNTLTIINSNNYQVRYNCTMSPEQRRARSEIMKQIAATRPKRSKHELANINPRSTPILDVETGITYPSKQDYIRSTGYSYSKIAKLVNENKIQILAAKMDESRFARSSTNIWITQNNSNLSIPEKDLEKYTSNGWVRGRFVPLRGTKTMNCVVCGTFINHHNRKICSDECRSIRFKDVAQNKAADTHKRVSAAMIRGRYPKT